MKFTSPLAVVLLLLLLNSGCSTVQRLVGFEEPEIRYTDTNVEAISLEQIDLRFNFEVENPNRVGINLEHYTYSLFINENDFLSGSHYEKLEIDPRSRSSVSLPLSLSYRDLFEAVSSVVQADSFQYNLNIEAGLDIPVYGTARIPLVIEGSLPRLKMPEVSFIRFDVHSLSLSSVDMSLTLDIANPNPMAMNLQDLNLDATIGNHTLANLNVSDIRLAPGENRSIAVQFSMGLDGLGRSLMDMLRGQRNFNYEIKGDGQIELDHPAFRSLERLPFHLIGDYRIGR